jgi:hypothetical protein
VTWDAVGAIGDFVGGIAVVASLIYLAIQVRHSARVTEQNTKEQQAASREAILDAFFRWRSLAADGELSRIYLRGCEDLASLTEEERFRFGLLIEEFILVNERLFARARDGTSEIPSFLAVRAVSRLLRSAGARQWWDENAAVFSPGFRAAILDDLSRSADEEDHDPCTAR